MYKFLYWLLREEEQKIYYQLEDGIGRRLSEIAVESCSGETLKRIIRCVLIDNPQFFWFEGMVSIRKAAERIIVKPQYLFNETEIRGAEKIIEKALSGFDILKSSCDFDKARAAYDWLLDNVSYSEEVAGQNIFDVFIERKAVCKGLSKAYQLILLRLGVFSTLIYGTIDGKTNHIWNVAEIDGKYYNVDVSLGYEQFDFLFESSLKSDRYRVFLKSDKSISEISTENAYYEYESDNPRLICEKNYGEE